MKIEELEIIKTQAEALNVEISIINYDVNRFSVQVGKHSYSILQSALSAVTTIYLRKNK